MPQEFSARRRKRRSRRPRSPKQLNRPIQISPAFNHTRLPAPIISNTREQCTGKVTLAGRGFQGTSKRRRLKAGCALQRRRRGLLVELPPSRSRKLRQERHMPKMSLLTELWKVGLRGLQRCHAYGVAGKPPMPQGFLGTMHHPWWLVSPAEPFPEGKAPLERRPTRLTFSVKNSPYSLRIGGQTLRNNKEFTVARWCRRTTGSWSCKSQ